MQTGFHLLDNVEKVRAFTVHFIYVCDTGNAVLGSLFPNRFRLGLNAAARTENRNRAVENFKRTLDFYGKVHVTGGIDDVDSSAQPLRGGSGGSNGNTSFLFLNHPVHGSGAVVDFADLMNLTGVEKDTLGGSGLSGVDVRHNTDVTGVLQTELSCHILSPE